VSSLDLSPLVLLSFALHQLATDVFDDSGVSMFGFFFLQLKAPFGIQSTLAAYLLMPGAMPIRNERSSIDFVVACLIPFTINVPSTYFASEIVSER